MTQSYMLQLHFNEGSNKYFGNDIFMHFRKSAKSSEIWFFSPPSSAWCTINAWCGHDSSLKHHVRNMVEYRALFPVTLMHKFCKWLSWGTKQTVGEAKQHSTGVYRQPSFPPLLFCFYVVYLAQPWWERAVALHYLTHFLCFQHLRLLSHIKEFPVEHWLRAWGNTSLYHTALHLLQVMSDSTAVYFPCQVWDSPSIVLFIDTILLE